MPPSTGYEALDAVALDIMSGDDIDPRRFDQIMDAIIELPAEAHVVVDNGASSFVPLGSYLLENQAIEVLEKHGQPAARRDHERCKRSGHPCHGSNRHCLG